ncbi:MFS transporter [Microbacterium marinilacus]|uniref:MFS transporter n=1 Tax=Microbacterium marinilacus TaxID=415209 RepID=A0ABP7BA35_9MICO|nr:MFS transporter [Microbacterium marinilacus]MBY0687038.1 MHS family MFS transporter [Microbacterium marinilacus]
MSAPQAPATPAALRQRRSMIGAFIGTAIEWYDFYIFGTAAALVFSQTFYPEIAPGAALLASFATFWVGFLMRPIGGMVFGHFGDRLGRKNILVITLVMMGAATTLIGVLPTYAQVGILAPVLLVVLRGVQGFAVGGEWGGAVLLSTENARSEKKGLAGAWVQQGSPAGSILATLIFLLVGLLPDEQFLTWGWRVPFLLSALLVVVGLVIRLKVEESQDFEKVRSRDEVAKAPVLVALRTAPALVALGMFASVMGIGSAYFSNTFLLSWTTGSLGIDRQLMLNILLGMAIVQFIWQPIAARISERFGVEQVMLAGLALNIVMVVPYFLAISAANPVWIAATLYLTIIGGTAYYALLATQLAAAFPAHIRYSGISLSYQLCATVFGGSTPLIAQWILNATGGSPWGVAAFYAGLLLITVAGVWGLRAAVRRHASAAPEPSAQPSRA